jgi:hypothetical protein
MPSVRGLPVESSFRIFLNVPSTPAGAALLLSAWPAHRTASDAKVTEILRGKYIGTRLGDPPASDAEHFIRCPACGGWIDCRDLGQVFEHEGPLPHPAQDQQQ